LWSTLRAVKKPRGAAVFAAVLSGAVRELRCKSFIVPQRVIGIEPYEIDSHRRNVAADGFAADASFMRGLIKPKLPGVVSQAERT
jgi:hypothetical protein